MKTKISVAFMVLLSIMNITLKAQSFYDLKCKTIDGKPFNFSSLKGKKVMIVNTASRCGHTKQYANLEEVYKEYKDKNFEIIGFPANNFGGQEPGSNADIKEFCTKNYGVSFQMMEKISVKGDDMDAVYHWLTEKKLNGKMDSEVGWNFQKYLIDEQGNLVDVIASKEKPTDEKVLSWIKK